MRIKTVFILFNGVVVFFMLTTGIAAIRTPILPGWELVCLAAICGTVLLMLDVYYFFNGKLLSILERDDWPALAQHLETEVIGKGRYTSRSVRLLAHAYLILSDIGSIINLENKTALANPKLIEQYALIFGVARILEKNAAGAANFFLCRLHSPKPYKKNLLWCRFYYGFAMLMDWRFSETADEFIILSKIAKNPIMTGLCAWFLSDYLSKSLPSRRAEIFAAAAEAQNKVKESVYDLQEWEKKTAKMSAEVHTVIINPYLAEAGKWIFAQPVS
jgi:hypothetical protein